MNFSQDILFALLISVLAQSTNTDLSTNTNYLLLLLLALNGQNSGCNTCNPCNTCNRCNSCGCNGI